MFNVEGTTISISRGDTGAVRFVADVTIPDTDESYTFGENDWAIFSIKTMDGELVRMVYAQMTDNAFTVTFHNADTEALATTNYTWDVRYVINAYWEGGVIVDGDQVITPELPMNFNILNVVGEV